MNDLLEYKEYFAEVHFSSDDETFFGKVMGINDLVSFEANTVAGLKREFRTAVDDYLATCKDLGKDPEKTYKGSFNVRISPELHRRAARYATAKNMSLNDFVRYAIDKIVSGNTKVRASQ